jgi:hypothetical protein
MPKINIKKLVVGLVAIILIVIGIVYVSVKVSNKIVGGANVAASPGNLLVEDYTPYTRQNGGTYTNLPIKTGSTLEVTGATTLSGLVTSPLSYDGFKPYGAFTTSSATGTVQNLYTNSSGYDFLCSSYSGGFYATTTGTVSAYAFAPSMIFTLGTSTSATGYSNNLLASTTVATSTPVTTTIKQSVFVLRNGESVNGMFGDITNTIASSTYYGNWSARWQITCGVLH